MPHENLPGRSLPDIRLCITPDKKCPQLETADMGLNFTAFAGYNSVKSIYKLKVVIYGKNYHVSLSSALMFLNLVFYNKKVSVIFFDSLRVRRYLGFDTEY